VFRPRFVVARVPREFDELSSEVLLSGEGVVGTAAEREIGLGVLAPLRECRHMVELDAVSFGATPSRGVGVSAAPFVALEDGAPDGSGDVSAAPARVLGLGLGLPGGLALGPGLALGDGVGLALGPELLGGPAPGVFSATSAAVELPGSAGFSGASAARRGF
jgi:hypothetical protein